MYVYNVTWSSCPPYLHPPNSIQSPHNMFPTQFHALFFFNNNPLCPVGAAHRHGVIQWGMKNLLVVTPQKKNDPPPFA